MFDISLTGADPNLFYASLALLVGGFLVLLLVHIITAGVIQGRIQTLFNEP